MIRFGSVCSGIEAASVAWNPLGWEAAWLAETDLAASRVLAHHYGASAPVFPLDDRAKRYDWPSRIVNWGDMTQLPGLVRAGMAQAPDVLCGGTPCQSFSLAGMRRGLADERGNLTLTFVDLANAIDEQREGDECVVFWENVPGILSSKDNAFGAFLAGLAGEDVPLVPPGRKWPNAGLVIGPQRTIAWRTFDAQYFGLAQRRKRVFVVASAREGFDPGEILFEFEGVRRDSPPRREAGQDVAGTLDARTQGGGFPGTDGACANRVVPEDRKSAELAPQWWDGSPVSQTLDAVLHKGQTMPEKNRFPAVLHPIAFSCKDYAADAGSISPTLRAMGARDGTPNGGQVAVATQLAVRRLTPRECARLQGFPDDYADIGGADGPRYKQFGNSWPVPCVRWIGERIDRALRTSRP